MNPPVLEQDQGQEDQTRQRPARGGRGAFAATDRRQKRGPRRARRQAPFGSLRRWAVSDRRDIFADTARERARQERRQERRVRLGGASAQLRLALSSVRQPDADELAPDVRADRRLVTVGLAISTIGLCLLAFVAYLFVFTGLQEARHQHGLLIPLGVPTSQMPVDPALSGKVPSNGMPAGLIQIPVIGVRQVLIEGTTASDLMLGPGIMPGTALPGTHGNAVIAGRRTIAGGPFGRLDDLQPGARIKVVTGLGEFTYSVVRSGTALPGDRDPIGPTPKAQLTLVTSNSSFIPTGRFYVVARLVSKAATAPIPTRPVPLAERALSGDSSAIVPSIVWGVVLALVLTIAFTAYRRWRDRLTVTYLLTTPVILAVALIWFENVARLLPATL